MREIALASASAMDEDARADLAFALWVALKSPCDDALDVGGGHGAVELVRFADEHFKSTPVRVWVAELLQEGIDV